MSLLRAGVTCALLLGLTATGSSAQPPCAQDAVTARALGQLQTFTGWLSSHHVRGTVGEVGWPAGPQWNALAARWYAAAGRAGLGAYAWAGAERWPADYPLAIYRGKALALAGPQARLVAHQPVPLRAIALADGSFGASGPAYSSQQPGRYGTDYVYPSRASLGALHARGITTVRVAFSWERLQSTPGGPLSVTELGRLREVLAAAATYQLRVVLDLHSYGRFASPAGVLTLGSPALPAAALADLWRRLAAEVMHAPGLGGYGLMNEPHDLPGDARSWEQASQLAVDAVRTVDRTTPILVAGYSYSSAARWASVHPRPWIRAGAGPVLYEAHEYFDRDGSGTYASSYGREETGARRAGWKHC